MALAGPSSITNSNRDSLSSFTSSRSSTSSRRPPAGLSIRPPPPGPFLPTAAPSVSPRTRRRRTTSALSRGGGSVLEAPRREQGEAGAADWLDDDGDDDDEGGDEGRESIRDTRRQQRHLHQRLSPKSPQSLHRPPSTTDDDRPVACEYDDNDGNLPTTPVTLPPACVSGHSSPDSVYVDVDDEEDEDNDRTQPREGSDMVAGLGLGFLESEVMASAAPEQTRRPSVPFPPMSPTALAASDARPASIVSSEIIAQVSTSPHESSRSARPSLVSNATSSTGSSSLSLPPADPVDLTLPNHPSGTFISVASGPMGRLAADSGALRPLQPVRGPRAFFTNLLSRSPRSPNPSTMARDVHDSDSPSVTTPTRSNSAHLPHPAVASARLSPHARSASMPSPPPAFTEFETADSESPLRRTPRSIAAATFSNLSRSASLRLGGSSAPSSPQPSSTSRFSSSPRIAYSQSVRHVPDSPAQTIGFATPPIEQGRLDSEPMPTLESIGLGLSSLTASMSLSRVAQPLCGAILDNQYLLIGTTAGLDFLPLPATGAFSDRPSGKKRKETRKPISLIKRTRFKQLAVLSERSNILLAIAGRNDHIRVYALDGIRAMIGKKMAEVDARAGYAYVKDGRTGAGQPKAPVRPDTGKGKARAAPPSASAERSQSSGSNLIDSSYRFPAPSPPPDYSEGPPTRAPRPRPLSRPNSFHQAASLAGPASPVRPNMSRSNTGTIVSAVPTNPRGSISSQGVGTSGSTSARGSLSGPSGFGPPLASPHATTRTIRGQKSREFVASRRSSAATVVARRRSRADMPSPTTATSRKSSIVSFERRPSASSPLEDRQHASGSSQPAASADDTETISTPLPPASFSSLLDNVPRSAGLDPSHNGPLLEVDHESTTSISSLSTSHGSTTDDATEESDNSPQLEGLGVRGVQLEKRASATPSREVTTPGPEQSKERVEDMPADRPIPRSATTPLLGRHESSPSMDLAVMLRETGPVERSSPFSSATSTSGSSALLPTSERSSSTSFSFLQRSPTLQSVNSRRGDQPAGRASRASSETFPTRRPGSAASHRSVSSRPGSIVPRSSLDNMTTSNDLGGKRLVARKPTTLASPVGDGSDEGEIDETSEIMTLMDIIRNGPPLPSSASAPALSSVSEAGHARGSSPQAHGSLTNGPSSPGNRSSKRWTMSGLLRPSTDSNSSAPNPQAATSSSSPLRDRLDGASRSLDIPRRRVDSDPTSASIADIPRTTRPPVTRPPAAGPMAATSEEPTVPDLKRRRSSAFNPGDQPHLPASTQIAPDAHPANSNSPLEYVKLARTKGARMMRAVETKKRTYLAVLCGEEGERIELFTGSRSISLSLNRTFVLPDTPRTIEFQLQGDDLAEIFLLYNTSIFGLEPSTVRVREVGVGRGERRARRERERRMHEVSTTVVNQPVDTSPMPATGSSTLHLADPARQERSPSPVTPEDETVDLATESGVVRASSPAEVPTPAPSSIAVPPPVIQAGRDSDRSVDAPDSPPPVPPRSKHSLPYTTFQQLPFVPPVPSSVLSSAWIIPPLYADVVGSASPPQAASPWLSSTEQPSIRVTHDGGECSNAPSAPGAFQDGMVPPLLSPISLLGGAAHRANGPPGLFFVSKGKNLSGIVTAEGKSIIKRPLVWSYDKNSDDNDDHSQRIEMLVVGGTNTVVIGIGPSEVKAIAVQGTHGQPPFGRALTVSALPPRAVEKEVQWLATHNATSQLFFAERVGQQITLQCLFARR